MMTHPEQKENEFYVGNIKLSEWPDPKLAGLQTARLGNVAYDVDGGRLPSLLGLRPLIIGRREREMYNSIMMAELSKITSGRG